MEDIIFIPYIDEFSNEQIVWPFLDKKGNMLEVMGFRIVKEKMPYDNFATYKKSLLNLLKSGNNIYTLEMDTALSTVKVFEELRACKHPVCVFAFKKRIGWNYPHRRGLPATGNAHYAVRQQREAVNLWPARRIATCPAARRAGILGRVRLQYCEAVRRGGLVRPEYRRLWQHVPLRDIRLSENEWNQCARPQDARGNDLRTGVEDKSAQAFPMGPAGTGRILNYPEIGAEVPLSRQSRPGGPPTRHAGGDLQEWGV